MGKKSKGGQLCNGGTIDGRKIYETHSKIKQIVETYKEVNKEVSEITQGVRENWVGKGRNEFESQYNILIKKIDDFGDTLKDIYDALVSSEASYLEGDDKLRQQYKMAMQG